MQMEGLGRRCWHRGWVRLFRLSRRPVGATRQRNQHLSRVLEVAPPQQSGALAGDAIGSIGRHLVIGDDHALGWRRSALRTPARGARLAALGPMNDRLHAVLRGLRSRQMSDPAQFEPCGQQTVSRRGRARLRASTYSGMEYPTRKKIISVYLSGCLVSGVGVRDGRLRSARRPGNPAYMNLPLRTGEATQRLRHAVAAHAPATFASSFGSEDMVIL